jgi:hypothetical protein
MKKPLVNLTLEIQGNRLVLGGGWAPGWEHMKDTPEAFVYTSNIEAAVSVLYRRHQMKPLRVDHAPTMARLAAELRTMILGAIGDELDVDVIPLVRRKILVDARTHALR